MCHNEKTHVFSLVLGEDGEPPGFSMNCSGGYHQHLEDAFRLIGEKLFGNFKRKELTYANIHKHLQSFEHKKKIKITNNVEFVVGSGDTLGGSLHDLDILNLKNSRRLPTNCIAVPLLIHTYEGKMGTIFPFMYMKGCYPHCMGSQGVVIKKLKELMDEQMSTKERIKMRQAYIDRNISSCK